MLMLRAAVCLLYALSHVSADAYSRSDFPADFVFGAGSSAYQVEGAAFEDGRTMTIADALAHSGRFGESNGDVACDEYHKYKEDVQLMVETGLEAYRFSISWSRLIPNGRGRVNPKGLAYYNDLINELVNHGIQPHITLLHQDFPMVLENEYKGFLSPKIVEDFTAFANVCFQEFGDRVKHWTSINEANLFALITYYDWKRPSQSRCYSGSKLNCTTRSLFVEDDNTYIVAHYTMLAHASAARLYKEKYQEKQGGIVGFSLYAFHFTPFSNTTEDFMAVNRSNIFFMGWFMHPLTYGDYPEEMKRKMGSNIPTFTKSDSKMLKGSCDFIALNYYSAILVKSTSSNLQTKLRDNIPYIDAQWLYSDGFDPLGGGQFPNTPWGLQGVLEYFKQVYENPTIFIYENGQSTDYNSSLDDPSRMEYLEDHIGSLLDALRNGSNARGYFAWSFLDLFEYMYGYEHTFGLYYVDFNDSNLTRHPKLSQKWYSRFLTDETFVVNGKGREDDKVPHFLPYSAL